MSTLYTLTLDAPDVIAANLPTLLPVYINLAKDPVCLQRGSDLCSAEKVDEYGDLLLLIVLMMMLLLLMLMHFMIIDNAVGCCEVSKATMQSHLYNNRQMRRQLNARKTD